MDPPDRLRSESATRGGRHSGKLDLGVMNKVSREDQVQFGDALKEQGWTRSSDPSPLEPPGGPRFRMRGGRHSWTPCGDATHTERTRYNLGIRGLNRDSPGDSPSRRKIQGRQATATRGNMRIGAGRGESYDRGPLVRRNQEPRNSSARVQGSKDGEIAQLTARGGSRVDQGNPACDHMVEWRPGQDQDRTGG